MSISLEEFESEKQQLLARAEEDKNAALDAFQAQAQAEFDKLQVCPLTAEGVCLVDLSS